MLGRFISGKSCPALVCKQPPGMAMTIRTTSFFLPPYGGNSCTFTVRCFISSDSIVQNLLSMVHFSPFCNAGLRLNVDKLVLC